MKILRVPYKMLAVPVPPRRLETGKTALLLLDFQKYTCNPREGIGALALERGIPPEFDEYYSQVDAAIENGRTLLEACRQQGVKVFFTFQYGGEDGQNVSRQFRVSQYPIPQGALAAEYLPGLMPAAGETVITRAAYSPFLHTDLETRLRAQGVETVILAGTLFNYSVALAAREAADCGFQVIVVWDASASETLDWHAVTRTGLVGGLILSRRTHEVIEMLKGTRT